MKNRLISIAIWILISVVAIVFLLAIAAAGLATEAFFTGAQQPAYAGVAPLLTAVVASSGVLVALLAFSRDREKLAREREENRSKILLEQAKAGLDEVIELLKDQNNNPLCVNIDDASTKEVNHGIFKSRKIKCAEKSIAT